MTAETPKTLPAQLEKAVDGIKSTSEKILYILFYRQGRTPFPEFTFFYHTTKDPRVAMERGKKHCEVQNYKFVSVRPAIVDFDKADNFMLNES